MRPLSPNEAITKLRRLCMELGWDAPLVANRTPEGLHDRGKHSLMGYFYTMYEMDSRSTCRSIRKQICTLGCSPSVSLRCDTGSAPVGMDLCWIGT